MDLISLVETQINTELLESRTAATDNLFRTESHFSIMNNNTNKWISRRQQSSLLSSVRGPILQLLRGARYDSTNLG